MPEVLKKDDKGNYFALFYRKDEEIDERIERLLKGRGTKTYEVTIVSESKKDAKLLEKEYKQSIEEILKDEKANVVVELGYGNNGEVLVGWIDLYYVEHYLYFKRIKIK